MWLVDFKSYTVRPMLKNPLLTAFFVDQCIVAYALPEFLVNFK